jgi:hypothetical protein
MTTGEDKDDDQKTKTTREPPAKKISPAKKNLQRKRHSLRTSSEKDDDQKTKTTREPPAFCTKK